MSFSPAPVVEASAVAHKRYIRTRRHKIKYPKNFDPARAALTVPDPYRWLPRSQRPGQAKRKSHASYIKGPQGLVSTEPQKPVGPSTAHIEVAASTSIKKKGKNTQYWSHVVACVSKDTISVLGKRSRTDAKISGVLLIDRHTREVTEQIVSDNCSVDTYLNAACKTVVSGVGLIGTVTLQFGTYLGVVTRAVAAGSIGLQHQIFTVAEVDWIPVEAGAVAANKLDQKYLNLINTLFRNTAGDFYFSPSFDLCGGQDRFLWNKMHATSLTSNAKILRFPWTLKIIHGSVKSALVNTNGRHCELILICRRSRHFAGTRYRKRGLNWSGNCANEVETEQIFISYGPPDILFSFAQVRGSVPLMWSQETQGLHVIKPEIVVRNTDLYLEATRRHFENLKSRYSTPIHAVSLLRTDPASHEHPLHVEYLEAVRYLTSFSGEPLFDADQKILRDLTLHAFDLKGSVGLSTRSVSPTLEAAESASAVPAEHMHSSALELVKKILRDVRYTCMRDKQLVVCQLGVVRTNCIDCLDRTNIFQYMVGLEVLSQQLAELGLLEKERSLVPTWAVASDSNLPSGITPLLEELYESTGDQLSYQYAGTAAHKKYSSGHHRSTSADSAASGFVKSGKELLISISRHYSSSFSDADKQHAMNLFLGLYAPWMDRTTYDDVCEIEGIDRFVSMRNEPGGRDLIEQDTFGDLRSTERTSRLSTLIQDDDVDPQGRYTSMSENAEKFHSSKAILINFSRKF